MTLQLTPERIAQLLLDFAVTKLRAGATPESIEQALIQQGAQAEVARLLVSQAVHSVHPA
ncbi:MAG: hypothetical protein HQL87_03700 [Magnetococcales bacterium]|nr:hypothetical protein [Magnetococcales bacterium]